MSGDGKVVVHRWFEDGENWATHPWFDGRERQLLAALAPHLRSGAGEFAVAGLGGTLIGETVPDPECADPKAKSRHPTILRAVFVSHAPSADESRTLLADLRRLRLPPSPGTDDNLEIRSGPARRTPANPREPKKPDREKPKKPIGAVIAIGVIGIVIAAVAVAMFGNGKKPDDDPPTAAKTDTKPTAPKTTVKPPTTSLPVVDAADLTPVDGEVPYLNERTSRRVKKILEGANKYDHPYVVFLNELTERLPESAPSCRDSAEVRQGLRKLLNALQPGDDTAEWSADRLRQAIDSALDYDAWRKAAGRRVYRDRDKPVDESLRRFLDPLRSPEPTLTAAARVMGEVLESWGESGAKELAARKPLAVIDRFFATLTRPTNLPSPLKVDHPHVAFLSRLPPEPVAEGQTFDDASDVAVALRHLNYLLDREFNPHADKSAAPDLIRRVDKQMDYAAWVKDRKEVFRDTGADLSPEVKRAMKRFDH